PQLLPLPITPCSYLSIHLAQQSKFFFFQAEDGIRDKLVTGVQTCALPICKNLPHMRQIFAPFEIRDGHAAGIQKDIWNDEDAARSEERRVGKECRSRR